MKKLNKTIAWIVLCAFLTGCSGYRAVNLDPGDPEGLHDGVVLSTELAVGQKVRVTTAAGERPTGTVENWDGDELWLKTGSPGRYEIVTIPRPEIVEVEVRATDDTATAVLVTSLVVIGVGTAVTAKAMSDLSNGFGSR